MATKVKDRRYTMLIPHQLFGEVQRLSEQRHISVVELFRKFIRIGLLIARLEDDPDSALIIRQGGKDEVVRLV